MSLDEDQVLETIALSIGGASSLNLFRGAVASHAGEHLRLVVRGVQEYHVVFDGFAQEALRSYVQALEQSKPGRHRWVLYKYLNTEPGYTQHVASGDLYIEGNITMTDVAVHNFEKILADAKLRYP